MTLITQMSLMCDYVHIEKTVSMKIKLLNVINLLTAPRSFTLVPYF